MAGFDDLTLQHIFSDPDHPIVIFFVGTLKHRFDHLIYLARVSADFSAVYQAIYSPIMTLSSPYYHPIVTLL